MVTMPNAHWMLEFPVASPGCICTHSNGCWGPQEYSLWPQLYHPRVVHHACIPVKGAKIDGIDYLLGNLWDPVSEDDWSPDPTCGVPDLGFLTRLCMASIKVSAQHVVFQFGRAGGGRNEGQKKYGYSLCTTLQQGLDCLTILPTWRTNAITLTAHICQLCLELCGFIVLFDIFQPHAAITTFCARQPLPLSGPFTAEQATAQQLYRLDILVWFIQPLTRIICIVEVILYPTPLSMMLSETLSQPQLYSGSGDMAAIVQHPGDWPFKM